MHLFFLYCTYCIFLALNTLGNGKFFYTFGKIDFVTYYERVTADESANVESHDVAWNFSIDS